MAARRRLPLRRVGRASLRLLLLAAFAYVLLLAILALEVPLALNVSDRINAEVKAQAASEAQLVAASSSGERARRSAGSSERPRVSSAAA